ncbi:MAG: hypothetical protein HXY45_22945 [Syntrophaceae bacterium]|nr:hypothetical protein [Syntrophaceae bacterium]
MVETVRKISGVLLGTAVGVMAVVVMVQVVTRYILKIPLFWAEEMTRYLFELEESYIAAIRGTSMHAAAGLILLFY